MVLVADIELTGIYTFLMDAKQAFSSGLPKTTDQIEIYERALLKISNLYFPKSFNDISNPIYRINKIALLDLRAFRLIFPKFENDVHKSLVKFHKLGSEFLNLPVQSDSKEDSAFRESMTNFVNWFDPKAKYGDQIKIFSPGEPYNINTKWDIKDLEKYKGDDDFVFISPLTTNLSSRLLIKLKQLSGYRNSSFDEEKHYLGRQIIKIEDSIKYLTYGQSLTYNPNINPDDVFTFNSIKFIPHKFSDILIYIHKYDSSNEFFNSDNHLHKVYTDCLQKIRTKILLVGGDRFIAEKFIEDVQDYLGEDFIYDCEDGDYYLGTSGSTIALRNIDKLSKSSLSKLIIELSQETHKDKLIILQSNTVLENFSPKQFFMVQLPSSEEFHEFYSVYFWMMLKQNKMIGFEGTEMESEEAIDALSNCRLINELLIKIPTLTEMYNLVQFLKSGPLLNPIIFDADFITDLENYIEKKFKSLENKGFMPPTQPSKINYRYDFEFVHQFNNTKKKDCWLIKNNYDGIECEVEYFTSLPLLYIAYIKKHFEITGRTKIDTDILYKDVKKYQNASPQKMPSKGTKHNIDSAFYSYFHRVNYPHLYDNKPLKKHKADLLELKKNLVKLFQDHYEINAYDSVIKDISLFNLSITDDSLEKFIRENHTK